MTELQARGNGHRDVLENYYNKDTLHHIALMESEADTEVAITDENHNVIIASAKLDPEELKIINMKPESVPRNGAILEKRWKSEKFISTVTPYYVNKRTQGYLYMFRSTDQVQVLINELNNHFIAAALITVTLLVLTILFLSQALTNPLIRMKKATEKLSKGDFSVHLPEMGNDELGELSRSIKILAKDLQHVKEERKEFLASISHELRTPLTYVKGYADVAKRPNIDSKEREKYLEIIYEESEKLSDMIKDLFDLAKIDKNTFVINRTEVELCSYLHTIYDKVLPAFKEKGMDLQINCNEQVSVYIDPMRFEQVIFNLLDNAIKYSGPNTVTNISMNRMRDSIVIKICDQGNGIPEEDLPYIFERFYRVEKSRSRDSGGTGLGLSIVKELIEAQDGIIEVTSRLSEGTTFTIRMKEMKE
ncbi:HAMP domain-containing sensor histidine kinase [Bacillus massiliigorillae]|uniref:HAMP domain-containing sensor histidine kinase n=1 Tax=Bacillus massiliigorillae TaxID=1243664 RepID=UPI0003AA048F|nr:HAMP domain-containing sensor histidine kinase [Bacillus massiliigorillae]